MYHVVGIYSWDSKRDVLDLQVDALSPTNDEVMVIIDQIYMCMRNFGIPKKCL